MQSSLPLVVSGPILLRRHIVPLPLNDAFESGEKTQYLAFALPGHADLFTDTSCDTPLKK